MTPPLRLVAAVATVGTLMAAGRWLGGPVAAVGLPFILIAHEAGHYLAMRRFGYGELRLLCVPLVGVAVVGRHRGAADWQRAVVFLAGPLPGIAAGGVLGGAGVWLGLDALRTLGLMTVGLNLVNLLPVRPLDGGWIAYLAVFRGRPIAEAWLRIVVAGLAAVVAVWTVHPAAVVVALVAFGSMAAAWWTGESDPPTALPLQWPVSAMVLFTYTKTVLAGGLLAGWLAMSSGWAATTDGPTVTMPPTVLVQLDAGGTQQCWQPADRRYRDLLVWQMADDTAAQDAFDRLAQSGATGRIGRVVYHSVPAIEGVDLDRDDTTPAAGRGRRRWPTS